MGFLEDSQGNKSSMRIAFMMVMILVIIYFGVWVYVSLTQNKLEPVDWTLVGLLGAGMGGKVGQTALEGKNAGRDDQ